MIKFDPTIGLGSLITLALLVCTIIAAWYKFGGRLDLIEYRVRSIEDTLKLIGDTLKQLAETDKRLSLMDQRQASFEEILATTIKSVEGLKRGDGYIQGRRANVDGEYTRSG